MADCDLILSIEALTELVRRVSAWCPVVPDYGDMDDAAKELIYLLASVRARTAKLEDVMHGHFYPAFPDLDAVGESDRPVIQAILRPLGVNQIKARNIVGIVHRFHARGLRFDDEAMRCLDRQGELWTFLETLPGVGAKLIECLRVFSFAYAGVPLDTHNWRVMWRFGVLWPGFVGEPGEPTAVKKRQAHLALRRIVSNRDGKALHNRLMRLGIEICTAQNPKCEACPLAKRCLRRDPAGAINLASVNSQSDTDVSVQTRPSCGAYVRLALRQKPGNPFRDSPLDDSRQAYIASGSGRCPCCHNVPEEVNRNRPR